MTAAWLQSGTFIRAASTGDLERALKISSNSLADIVVAETAATPADAPWHPATAPLTEGRSESVRNPTLSLLSTKSETVDTGGAAFWSERPLEQAGKGQSYKHSLPQKLTSLLGLPPAASRTKADMQASDIDALLTDI